MVVVFLIYPIVVAAGLFVVDEGLPIELVRVMSSSIVFNAVLSVLVLTAVLAAAYRKKDNPVLMSAWLFLFCGLAILSLGSFLDPLLEGHESWAEELFSAASFFPLLFFSLYIASPLRLVILSRRQRALYALAGIVVLLAVFAIVFLPWLFLYEGPRLHSSTKHLLRLAKPLLDTLLAEPIALLILVIGLTSGSGPYMFIGLGLMLLIPEDILDHFRLLRELDQHGQLADLFSIASHFYLLNGALLCIFSRTQSSSS